MTPVRFPNGLRLVVELAYTLDDVPGLFLVAPDAPRTLKATADGPVQEEGFTRDYTTLVARAIAAGQYSQRDGPFDGLNVVDVPTEYP